VFFLFHSNYFLNLCRQTKIHNIGATLVGVDKYGNKYYEKTENTQYGWCPTLSVYISMCMWFILINGYGQQQPSLIPLSGVGINGYGQNE